MTTNWTDLSTVLAASTYQAWELGSLGGMGASSHQALLDLAWLVSASTSADLVFAEPMLGANFSFLLAALLSSSKTHSIAAALGLDLIFSMVYGVDALPGLFLANSGMFTQAASHQDLAFMYGAWLQAQLGFFLSYGSIGDALAATAFNVPLWALFWQNLDLALLGIELLFVLFAIARITQLPSLARLVQPFYDDITTFCKQNGLSLTELAMLTALSVGFIFFDLFVTLAEDDIVDAFNYVVFLFVLFSVLSLVFALDVLVYFMVSGLSSGDLSLRVIANDIINNALCLLRIFFCWVRYIFYDLQTEFVDFTYQYTDTANEATLLSFFSTRSTAPWADGFSLVAPGSAWNTAAALFGVGCLLLIDLVLVIVQVLACTFKLAIAFFLLWLIVDLFLLRLFAHTESTGLTQARRRYLGSHRMW